MKKRWKTYSIKKSEEGKKHLPVLSLLSCTSISSKMEPRGICHFVDEIYFTIEQGAALSSGNYMIDDQFALILLFSYILCSVV